MSMSSFICGRLPRLALLASLVLMLLLLAGCSAANLQAFLPRTAQRP